MGCRFEVITVNCPTLKLMPVSPHGLPVYGTEVLAFLSRSYNPTAHVPESIIFQTASGGVTMNVNTS
jgi:hypothetical protein